MVWPTPPKGVRAGPSYSQHGHAGQLGVPPWTQVCRKLVGAARLSKGGARGALLLAVLHGYLHTYYTLRTCFTLRTAYVLLFWLHGLAVTPCCTPVHGVPAYRLPLQAFCSGCSSASTQCCRVRSNYTHIRQGVWTFSLALLAFLHRLPPDSSSTFREALPFRDDLG